MEVCPGILTNSKNCIRLRQFSIFGPQPQNCVENFLVHFSQKYIFSVICFFMLTINLAWLLPDKSNLREEVFIWSYISRGIRPPWCRCHGTRQGRCRSREGGWLVTSALRKLSVDRKWGGAIKPRVPPAPNPILQGGYASQRFHKFPNSTP